MYESAHLASVFSKLAALTNHTAFQEHFLLVTCLSLISLGIAFLYEVQTTLLMCFCSSLDREMPGGTDVHSWSKDVPDEVSHNSGLRTSPKNKCGSLHGRLQHVPVIPESLNCFRSWNSAELTALQNLLKKQEKCACHDPSATFT